MNKEEYFEEMLLKYKQIKDDIYENHPERNQIYHFVIRVIRDLEEYKQKYFKENEHIKIL